MQFTLASFRSGLTKGFEIGFEMVHGQVLQRIKTYDNQSKLTTLRIVTKASTIEIFLLGIKKNGLKLRDTITTEVIFEVKNDVVLVPKEVKL